MRELVIRLLDLQKAKQLLLHTLPSYLSEEVQTSIVDRTIEDIIPYYMEQFTENELATVVEFYSSEVGRKCSAFQLNVTQRNLLAESMRRNFELVTAE